LRLASLGLDGWPHFTPVAEDYLIEGGLNISAIS
jgi:hypothetical protein